MLSGNLHVVPWSAGFDIDIYPAELTVNLQLSCASRAQQSSLKVLSFIRLFIILSQLNVFSGLPQGSLRLGLSKPPHETRVVPLVLLLSLLCPSAG